jgi:ectoine hydroxylase
VNLKQGLTGESFYWHSDFETWHMEDGMPAMRALSVSLNLTDNLPYNGSLMIIPGSHLTFIGCRGKTPDEHYRQSLRAQQYGVPSHGAIAALVDARGVRQLVGPAGSAVLFDSNCIHGSNSNISPLPRRNLFLVYNSVDNELCEPLAGTPPRPEFIAARRSGDRPIGTPTL